MSEVNPELRVPFTPDPFHTEAWLRAEKPGATRISILVEAQPPQYRPMLRRLFREAAEAIVATEPASLEDREAWNHASSLLQEENTDAAAVFSKVDVVPVDPDAEKDEQIAQARAAADAALAEVERLKALLAEAPTGDPEDGDEDVEPESDEPEVAGPTPAEQAESDAILDAILEEDQDDAELPPYSGPEPGAKK